MNQANRNVHTSKVRAAEVRTESRTLPLSGIKVIELGNFISAPYCGKLLADSGADVIKIERPGSGDESRSYGPFPQDIPDLEKSGLFLYLNTSKRGVTLNLDSHTGRALFHKLLANADVLIENCQPEQYDKWELNYDCLSQVNPRLVVTSISPYGRSGPYQRYRAYHHNACALGGVFTMGDPEREPLTLPLFQGHFQGGIHGAVGTMMALFARQITNEGQHVDIAEADIWAGYFSAVGIQAYVYADRIRKRAGHRTKGFYYPLCILPCKDGYISEVAVLGTQWKSFLELIGRGQVPEWYQNDPRFQDRVMSSIDFADELDRKQSPWLMQYTKEEIFAMCRERRIPFAPVYTIDEVVNHVHLKEYGYFVDITHPKTGPLKYPGAPFRFSETPMRSSRAPLLGEHNHEVYCNQLGLSKEDLVRLTQAGVV